MSINSKIDSIRQATIQAISTLGLANSSVASIAKIAGVSDGYLYRHYIGKNELIRDVLDATFDVSNQIIEDLLKNSRDIEHYIEQFTERYFDMIENEPDKFKFLILIQNDFSFTIDPVMVEKMKYLCNRIMDKCRASENYRQDLSLEDIYMAFIVLPQQYAKMILRDDFGLHLNKEEVGVKIKKMILGALK